jgi:hypothetical protein
MTAKERQQKSNERRKLRGFKEGKMWLSPASQAALEAEVTRRTARGERAMSRQVVLAELVEAAMTAPGQADVSDLRRELAHARAEIARLEEKVRYGRG